MGWLRGLVYGEIQCANCGCDMPAYLEDGPNPVYCSPDCQDESDTAELIEDEDQDAVEEWF